MYKLLKSDFSNTQQGTTNLNDAEEVMMHKWSMYITNTLKMIEQWYAKLVGAFS